MALIALHFWSRGSSGGGVRWVCVEFLTRTFVKEAELEGLEGAHESGLNSDATKKGRE